MRQKWSTFACAALLASALGAAGAQQPATQPEVGPKVGEEAPDFEFTAITRYGKLANAHRLTDFRGQTVVLAFFPKARTRG